MADDDAPETPEEPQHAVPGEDAREIAGSAEDAALEAAQEAQEQAAGEPAGEEGSDAALQAAQESEEQAAVEAAVDEGSEDAEEEAAEEEAARGAGGAKQAVPGAHLEVDIVPEGVDPLGRGEQDYEDPYAVTEPEAAGEEQAAEPESDEEVLAEPISTAAIDLASGARYRATGKRKTAIARVTLRPGSGSYLVNGRALEEHFPRTTLQRNIRQPLETVGYQDRMDVIARLHGGGISAQAGALRHGVSRALLEADPNLRGELKRRGFLTRDSRAKERKKAGLKKARKRPQFSKR
jgi:small subunit ribosomal protein S9